MRVGPMPQWPTACQQPAVPQVISLCSCSASIWGAGEWPARARTCAAAASNAVSSISGRYCSETRRFTPRQSFAPTPSSSAIKTLACCEPSAIAVFGRQAGVLACHPNLSAPTGCSELGRCHIRGV